MGMLNYTTTKSVDVTVGEITKLLAKNGVASVSTRYSEVGEANGLAFALRSPHGMRDFHLPVNVAGVHSILKGDPKAKAKGPRYLTREHAERVAWRVVKDWIEAQLALIDAAMASLDEVMLPYLIVNPDGTTLYQNYAAREAAALES